MKTKLVYVADDGTSFDTEKECIDYEKPKNSYIVFYKDKETSFSQIFDNESSAKRSISDLLHDCYKNGVVGKFKLVHRIVKFKLIHHEKTVEFDSNELARFVPAHYNIDGDKLDEVFQI